MNTQRTPLSSSTGDQPRKRDRALHAGLTLYVVIVACVGTVLFGCVTPKRVVRASNTYTTEILASLARQEAAAEALATAAARARADGDTEACREYYAPAHLIDVKARPQAYRALYLAGLPYPLPNGTPPDPKVEQDDPGPAGSVNNALVEAFCLDTVIDIDDEVAP